jgi:hypothetical protein
MDAQLQGCLPDKTSGRGSALADNVSRETFQNAGVPGLIKGSMRSEGAQARPVFHVKQPPHSLRRSIKTG